ncbi:hypothetical protein BKA83DRAFT_4361685 [Pisolithus microcarpus]|nr:hypothetical protein BKA83DRAFT_4361685 [Pisolithus microcarpus]
MVLLSVLTLPHLIKASNSESPSRLVVVSSFGHHIGVGKLKNAKRWENMSETMNDMEFFNRLVPFLAGYFPLSVSIDPVDGAVQTGTT